MTRRRKSTYQASHRAGRDALTLAAGAPQVVSMRLARMAAHGLAPNAGDLMEMHRMGAEKIAAFSEAWAAMGMQTMRAQQALWQQWPQWLGLFARPGALMQPASMSRASSRAADAMAHGFAQVAAAGLSPLSRRVRSNVKRLGARKTKTRR